jgi:hypothetical protein
MEHAISTLSQRELVVRVATLELLVADLIHLLRVVDPQAVDGLVREATMDRDINDARAMPADAEHQRFRLHQVFAERVRALSRRRVAGAGVAHPIESAG